MIGRFSPWPVLYFTLTEQCLVLDVYTVVLEGKALREHRRAPVGPGLEAARPHDAALGRGSGSGAGALAPRANGARVVSLSAGRDDGEVPRGGCGCLQPLSSSSILKTEFCHCHRCRASSCWSSRRAVAEAQPMQGLGEASYVISWAPSFLRVAALLRSRV